MRADHHRSNHPSAWVATAAATLISGQHGDAGAVVLRDGHVDDPADEEDRHQGEERLEDDDDDVADQHPPVGLGELERRGGRRPCAAVTPSILLGSDPSNMSSMQAAAWPVSRCASGSVRHGSTWRARRPSGRGMVGGCGIRTLGEPKPTTAFEAAPFVRSGNLPATTLVAAPGRRRSRFRSATELVSGGRRRSR